MLWLMLNEIWLGTLESMPQTASITTRFRGQVPFLFAVSVMLFLLVLSVHYVVLAFEAFRTAERQQLELQVLTRDAELRALRAQVNPHFLYNSLNSISALTGSDPAAARRMCLLLAEFLRTDAAGEHAGTDPAGRGADAGGSVSQHRTGTIRSAPAG
jgi:sensor histidine kinase YesM